MPGGKGHFQLTVCCALMLGMASAGTVKAQRAPASTSSQTQAISHSEKYRVCCELAQRRVLDLRTALAYIRSGRLEIGKVRTGQYWAKVMGGPMITILIDDNI